MARLDLAAQSSLQPRPPGQQRHYHRLAGPLADRDRRARRGRFGRVLVTGATGFVGGAAARAVLDSGRDVLALVRPELRDGSCFLPLSGH
jgi:NAD dependent epimerase/dehydratase family